MSAKNIIVGEIRTVLSRLRLSTRWKSEIVSYNTEIEEYNLIDSLNDLLNQVSDNEIEVNSIDTSVLLLPFIMVLKCTSVTGPIVESVLTAIDTFFQSGILQEHSINIRSSISVLLEAVSKCRFEATDRSQDEVVLVHMLELLRSTISLPVGNVLSDKDIWNIFDTVFINSQEVGYSRLLRKVAERVLRDITIIIFRRFASSTILSELQQQHIQQHKLTGMQFKIRRDKSVHSSNTTPRVLLTSGNSSPTESSPILPNEMPSWDAAALHIITFLSSRINPNARGVGVSEDDSNNTLCLCLRLMRMALESCGGKIASSEPFFNIISDEFFKHLLMLALRPTVPLAMLSEIIRIFSFFTGILRIELKLQIEMFFQRIVFWTLEGNAKNPNLVPLILDMLIDLSYDKTLLVDLYVNYDCDPQRCDLLETLYKLLSKLALNDHSNASTTAAYALHIMYNGIKSIDRGIISRLEKQQQAIESGEVVISNEPTTEECTYHMSPQMLWLAKLKKRTLQKGAIIFNQSAKEGLKYLQEAELLPNPSTPHDVAHFLRFTPDLDKQQIGEYLGKNKDENKQTLYEYVRTFDFRNISLLTALRMFLDTFRLPGEAQQIDRIMETFAEYAYEQTLDHTILINPDVTYCVCFSIIMLNTDLHNPNMKPERRMQLKDFIKLNRSYGDMNEGKELSEEFLVAVYKSIASEQIFTSSAATSDQLRTEQWVNVIRQSHVPETQQFIAHSPSFFANCKTCNVGMYDRDIFSIIWGPILATAGAVLEVVTDSKLLEFSLDSFVTLAHIASYYNMTNVLDNLIYFLTKFSKITTEYITENGENDPIEFIIQLGEQPAAQLCLVSLCGIIRKLGSTLGKSWNEVMAALCHLFFLGLFPVSRYVKPKYQIITSNERTDLIIYMMVDGVVDEKYSNKRSILSMLFTWSPEEDVDENHIQMAPIDPAMWDDFQQGYHAMLNDEEVKMTIAMERKERRKRKEKKSEEKEEVKKSDEEDKKGEDKEEVKKGEDKEEDTKSEGKEEDKKSEGKENNKQEHSSEDYDVDYDEDYYDEDYYDEDYDEDTSSNSYENSYSTSPLSNPYELSSHETKSIESVLECIDKCRLDLLFTASLEWSNNTLLSFISAAVHLAESPYQLAQRKKDEQHRNSVIACMYSRIFVIELLTGLMKYNLKRIDIIMEPIMSYFINLVEQCTYLNLEVQSVIEYSFDLLYCCLNESVLLPVYQLFTILLAITRLSHEVFQSLAPIIASGVTVLISEYGKTLGIAGCWENVINLIQACISAPHAVSRCYKCIELMFKNDIADAIPPSAISLIASAIEIIYLSPTVYKTLMDDIIILNNNCWKIIMQEQSHHEDDNEAKEQEFITKLWQPILYVICNQCELITKDNCDETISVMKTIFCNDNMKLIPFTLYGQIMVNNILPAVKNILLIASDVTKTPNGEKPRVTRVTENGTLSNLGLLLLDLLKLRFESLIVLDTFTTIWTMSISILQFIQSISVPQGQLQHDNIHTIQELLKFANGYALFETEEGPHSSELWKQTVHMLNGIEESILIESLVETKSSISEE